MADGDLTTKLCACGCGEFVKPERRPHIFIPGHNGRGRWRKPRFQFTCNQCGKVSEGTAAKVRNRSYCSNECRDAFRRERIGTAHPHYKRVEQICQNCGKPFVVIPSRLRRGTVYCSMECGHRGRSRKLAGKPRPRKGPQAGIHAAKKRDDFACRICGFNTVVHGHHIAPRRAGGSNNIENIITLCPNHHAMVHARLLTTADLRAAMPTEAPNPMPAMFRAKHMINYRTTPA
jgi:5-methylcytosine-specific restriction endonuclease McrA